MPDREKVIKELEEHIESALAVGIENVDDVPLDLLQYTVALLKAQEPKQVEAEVINEIDRLYRCPSCHISMILRKQPYCHSCGQAVKWYA